MVRIIGDDMSAIDKAVKEIGGQTKLAKLVGTKQNAVWNWINRHQQAPAKYIREISKLTNGEVSIEELLADHEKTTKTGISL